MTYFTKCLSLYLLQIIFLSYLPQFSFQSLKVDEVFLQGALTDEDGRFNCEDIVRLLKYGEGLK